MAGVPRAVQGSGSCMPGMPTSRDQGPSQWRVASSSCSLLDPRLASTGSGSSTKPTPSGLRSAAQRQEKARLMKWPCIQAGRGSDSPGHEHAGATATEAQGHACVLEIEAQGHTCVSSWAVVRRETEAPGWRWAGRPWPMFSSGSSPLAEGVLTHFFWGGSFLFSIRVRVMLTSSYYELRSIPASLNFWISLRRIGVRSSLSVFENLSVKPSGPGLLFVRSSCGWWFVITTDSISLPVISLI